MSHVKLSCTHEFEMKYFQNEFILKYLLKNYQKPRKTFHSCTDVWSNKNSFLFESAFLHDDDDVMQHNIPIKIYLFYFIFFFVLHAIL